MTAQRKQHFTLAVLRGSLRTDSQAPPKTCHTRNSTDWPATCVLNHPWASSVRSAALSNTDVQMHTCTQAHTHAPIHMHTHMHTGPHKVLAYISF